MENTVFIIEQTNAANRTNNRTVLIADHRYTESSPFCLQCVFTLIALCRTLLQHGRD